jgi:hypothetical protein
MINLRAEARNRPCMIRVPDHCCADPQTTVGCHVRIAGVSGAGIKSSDLFIAWGCFTCHAVVDGRQKSEFTYEQRRLMLLEGMLRTQDKLRREGKLLCE